jgi:hypothetical protein
MTRLELRDGSFRLISLAYMIYATKETDGSGDFVRLRIDTVTGTEDIDLIYENLQTFQNALN